jgi:hypothetical protein
MATALPDGNRIGAIIQSMFTRIKVCGSAPNLQSQAAESVAPSVMRAGAAVNCRAPCGKSEV